MAELTLSRADELSPDTVRNQIVRDLQQLRTRGPRIDDVLPTIVLSDSEETYYRMDSAALPMRQTHLSAEAPTGDTEDLSEDQYSVDTFKKKRSPERGADFELNNNEDLLNAFNWTVNQLERELRMTREVAGWQGLDDVNGLIGTDGQTAHPSLSSDHVITGATAFSNTSTATPQAHFHEASYLLDTDGLMLDEMPTPTAYISPSVERDLKQNDNLESRFSGVAVQGLTMEQVANVLPIDNLEVVYTQKVRTNDQGEPIDDSDTVVDDRSNAVKDNILEPYDYTNTVQRRNIVFGTAGDEAAGGMPVLTDRLDNIVQRGDESPNGSWAVDNSLGFITQSWWNEDPPQTWYKVAQEFGVEIVRPENWTVIQDI
jgi:hypothetical protein